MRLAWLRPCRLRLASVPASAALVYTKSKTCCSSLPSGTMQLQGGNHMHAVIMSASRQIAFANDTLLEGKVLHLLSAQHFICFTLLQDCV